MSWTVHKFGGSSLADADCFRRVAGIVRDQPAGNLGVVVSAVGGVTDMLFDLIDRASRQQPVGDALDAVRQRHVDLANELFGEEAAAQFMEQFETDLGDIRRILAALALVKATSRRSQDMISGFGELWSARLLSGLLAVSADTAGAAAPAGLSDAVNSAAPAGVRGGTGLPVAAGPADRPGTILFIDARDVLTVEPGEMGPVVVWEETRSNLAAVLSPGFDGVAVITGYIARNSDGLQTTLGRNGSDYSASIFAALLGADAVHIWTDVEGVMSGDPRRVPEATVIGEISYNEAMELAYFGARVIHPQTMAPAVSHEIPIRIRSTFDPEHPGSRIIGAPGGPETVVKGISGIDGVALVNLEGSGMIGVPGTADRLFGALRDAGVSVMLISQGSSEHSICFAVPEESAELVKSVVEEAFALELAQAQVQKVDITTGCGVLAVVGDGMAGTPGVSGRFFATLGKAGINVRAIAQGASERNISAVISSADMTRALRTVHASFYLSAKTVSIGLIGPGSVGSVLLDQMAGEVDRLREDFNLDLRVRGLGGSRRMALDDRWVDLEDWRSALEQGSEMDLPRFVDHVQAEHLPHAVLVDCTADAGVAAGYADWLQRGIHVITPNKRAHSGTMDNYRRLKSICRSANTHFLYETTVGAGLPVIKTLRDLVETGDDIASISGIFSGTLAYLCNVFDATRPFSEIVRDARAQGYTEPDPRDDLSGMDVARKAVILAREAGLELELADIEVESLVPAELSSEAVSSVDEFLDRLADFDAPMAERFRAAEREDRVLRYVAEVELASGQAEVALRTFPRGHPFAGISLTDNVVQFVTRRYADNPLIVRGPGAGPDVTAAGIFADILRLCSMLGANHA